MQKAIRSLLEGVPKIFSSNLLGEFLSSLIKGQPVELGRLMHTVPLLLGGLGEPLGQPEKKTGPRKMTDKDPE